MEVQQKPNFSTKFREDLRQPKAMFGRCGITGEWAQCIAVDLGDVSIPYPDMEKAQFDTAFKRVTFPELIYKSLQIQLMVSKKGLEILSSMLEHQSKNSGVTVTPKLVYQWSVYYNDGETLNQFTEEDDILIEHTLRDIDFDRVTAIELNPLIADLPTYKFNLATGEIRKNDELLDFTYTKHTPFLPGETEIVLCRQNTILFGSTQEDLERDVEVSNVSTLYLLGWRVGGISAEAGKGLVIAVDERGYWRPFIAE